MLFRLNNKIVMKIEFGITSIPSNNQKQYFTAYLEGFLKFFLGGKLFFDSDGLLLIELGVSLRKWLDKLEGGQLTDFYFETMDSDETPILSFKYNEKDGFYFKSVWQEFEAVEAVQKDMLIKVIDDFLNKLDIELSQCSNVRLIEFME